MRERSNCDYAVATRDYGQTVWNDAHAVDCPIVDAYRADHAAGLPDTKPNLNLVCLPGFANTDIYGFSTAP